MDNSCVVCLESRDNLEPIRLKDEQQVTIKEKLYKLVPEITWDNDSTICLICLQQVEKFWAFRDQCIQSFFKCQNRENEQINKKLPERKCERKEEFVCFHCTKKFRFKKYLSKHIQTKHANKEKVESIQSSLRRLCQEYENIKNEFPVNEDDKKEEFVCFHCTKMFSLKNYLAKHIQTEHANKEKVQSIQSSLRHLCQEYENIKNEFPVNKDDRKEKFVCFHCTKTYKLKYFLVQHIQTKHANKRKVQPIAYDRKEEYVCFLCEKKFVLKRNLDKHIQHKHTNNNNKPKILLKCQTCGNFFCNKSALTRHITNVHATSKKFKCELCDKKFPSRLYLNMHKKIHSGERDYFCYLCDKSYTTSSSWSRHKKMHENKRAYTCQICAMGFNTGSCLRIHKIRVHQDSSLWKFNCSICGKKFYKQSDRNRHMKVHEKHKDLSCSFCSNKYSTRVGLNGHLKKQHLSEVQNVDLKQNLK